LLPPPSPELAGRGRTRVLIVDDEPRLRAAWERLIGAQSDLETAPSLEQADALQGALDRHRPKVVLLDVTMHGMDPLAALSEVSAKFPDVRVIVYTAHNDPVLVERSMRAGAAAFVDKFAPVQEVLDTIRRVAHEEGPSRPPPASR
jgi:DNA-binding NarL/FixJ family response regulator